jgi:holdfast attachment protein HfaA
MSNPMSNMLKTACIAALLAVAATNAAQAATDYSSAATYSTNYGMSAGEENATVNPSLRDGNGNLTVVNGQFTSSSMSQQSGAQNMSGLTGNGTSSGVGYGTASAIGNSLNVVTNGNNNTVIVNSTQTNNGNQTATVSMNGH